MGTAGSFFAGPDQDRALALAQALAESVSLVGEAAAALERVARLLDLCALPARGLDPELDDRRALSDRLVAEDDDELGVADRREREPERVEGGARLLGQHAGVRAETGPHEPSERVRLLDRLPAGERGHDPSLRLHQRLCGLAERFVPREHVEAAAAAPAQ